MSDLINQLRRAAQEILESNPQGADLMFRGANAIEEYRLWLEIIQNKAAENYDSIDDIKSMLNAITDFLKMMAGKY